MSGEKSRRELLFYWGRLFGESSIFYYGGAMAGGIIGAYISPKKKVTEETEIKRSRRDIFRKPGKCLLDFVKRHPKGPGVVVGSFLGSKISGATYLWFKNSK